MTTETASEKLRVFVSYSRRDSLVADGIVAALESEGFEVKIDRRDLPFGEEWQTELAEFIRISDTVIWLVSEHSIRSEWVNWELDEVKARSKRLIPVLVGATPLEALPRQIGSIHILPSGRIFDLSRDFEALVDVLETDRAWLKQASRLQDRASEWMAKGRAAGLLLSRAALTDAERWKDARPSKAPAPSQDIMDLMFASRRVAAARQRWWVMISTAITTGALCLAGVAAWQWTVATDYAEVSQQGVDDMIFKIVRVLRDERGITNETAQKLLSTADRVVDKMAATSWDTTWQDRHIAILGEFADLSGARGDTEQQLKYARSALAAAKQLADKEPASDGVRRGLWVAYGKVADALEQAGDRQGALQGWQEALSVARALSGKDAANVRWRRDLAVSLCRLGSIHALLDHYDDALSSFESCLSIRRRLVDADASNLDLQRELALCLGGLGDLFLTAGKRREATAHYEEESQITRRVARGRPNNLDAQFRLSISLQRLGALHREDAEFARPYVEECRDIRSMLGRADGDISDWKVPCE